MQEPDHKGGARQKPWVWMALAFCAAVALVLCIFAVFEPKASLHVAIIATARLAFLIFLPAYVGGPLTSLFGNAFRPVRDHARDFGLAFASAILVHLGLVAYLCSLGHAPPVKTFVVFGLATVCTYSLALLSIPRVRKLLPVKVWPAIRFVATNYIALAFLDDFKKFPLTNLRDLILYLPFATLTIGGLILNLIVWVQSLDMFGRMRIRQNQ